MNKDGVLLAGAVLAGVSVTTPVEAATQMEETSFIFEFNAAGFATQEIAFDPFSGSADQLTGVTFNFDSRVNVESADLNTALSVNFLGSSPSTLLGSLIDISFASEFSFVSDLLDPAVNDAQGDDIEKADFVGGPVAFRLGLSVEESSVTGVWYAGANPFGGGDLTAPLDLGSVTLTYTYDDGVPTVPLPAGLPLMAAGMALLGGAALRRKGRTS